SPANYLDVLTRNTVFSDLAAARGWTGNLTGGDRPEKNQGTMATARFFRGFGMRPMFGRYLSPQDEKPGNDHVVVLSYGLWTRLFSSDRSIIGQDILLNGEKYRVVGVMPSEFFSDPYGQLWLPSPWVVPTHSLLPN